MQNKQKKKFSELNLYQDTSRPNGELDENEEFHIEMIKDLLLYQYEAATGAGGIPTKKNQNSVKVNNGQKLEK